MRLHIRELILWPINPAHSPISIPFDPRKICVITGWCETGKSSILAIIDYVLGSSTCAIPVGVIRESVEWYGLRIETAMGLLRVARRRSENRQTSTDFEVLTHDEAARDVGVRPQRDRHLDQFKALMQGLTGLSDLPLTADTEPTGWTRAAGFRDMAAFNFLPQHIVANPYTLFYKTDTTVHRERLKRLFPLVLGLKTNEQLAIEHRLTLLRTEERRLGAEFRRRDDAINTWRSQVIGSYLRAQELNLLPEGDPPRSIEPALEALRRLAALPPRYLERIPTERTKAAVERREQYRREGDVFNHELGDSRRQLQRLQTLNSTVSDYGADLVRQRERVGAFDWFLAAVPGEHQCPMCGTTQDSASRIVEQLRRPIEELEGLAAAATGARSKLDREVIALETRIREIEGKLFANRRIRRELEVEIEINETPTAGQRLEDVYMFLGGIRQALASIREVHSDEGMAHRLRELRGQIRDLEQRLLARRQRISADVITRTISDLIQLHALSMGLGHTDLYPVLDQKELNIRFIGPDAPLDSRGDLLWEVGSAANWMGYHLCTLVALHEFFDSRQDENPVPDFLIIDQPSQAYFPSDTYEERIDTEVSSENRLSDLAKTRQIFEFLASVKKRDRPDLQIIVVEHADERTWVGLGDLIEKVRDWRGSGDRLIPAEWLGRFGARPREQ